MKILELISTSWIVTSMIQLNGCQSKLIDPYYRYRRMALSFEVAVGTSHMFEKELK